MYRISKKFAFSASHSIFSLPAGHQCRRLHGHNYEVDIVLESEELDSYGFVRDYGDLDPIKQWLDATLDHRHLNEILTGEFAGQKGVQTGLGVAPTAENLARYIFDTFKSRFPELWAVGISETPKTWAYYYG